MDYKYIEQLIERYFTCETTQQEEQILRSFFSQGDVPSNLSEYADLFRYESSESDVHLGDDFDAKMMELVERKSGMKNNVVSIRGKFTPLFKAAAIVAIVLTIGSAAEQSIGNRPDEGIEDVTAINPYIRKDNISAAIKVKDNTQAETQTAVVTSDSLMLNKND